MDIDRFKTDKISEYFRHILDLLNRWDFRKLRAECTAAQSAIVSELKDNYIKPNGLALKIDEHRPNRHQGSKEERIAAILEPRYDNLQMYHYRGGNCQVLEEELVSYNPAFVYRKVCEAQEWVVGHVTILKSLYSDLMGMERGILYSKEGSL